MDMLIAYGLLGIFAGTMAGLLGVGGGLIIVPILVFLWQPEGLGGTQAVQLALGTSLASIIFTSISSVRAHHRRGAVQWPLFWHLVPGLLAGAWLGAALAAYLPGNMLKTLFGFFELLVAAQMATAVRPAPHRTLPNKLGMGFTGSLIGAISAIVGIGGGTLTVPFLTWCNVRIQHAIATSAACGLPIAIGGALSYAILGWGHTDLPEASAGYIYGPALLGIVITSVLFAPLGAALAHRLSTTRLKQVFAGFLALLGIWMLLG